jgi:hypothetical protein
MPGPISDCYDPIWSTASNRDEVINAIKEVRKKIAGFIETPPKYILNVIREPNDLNIFNYPFSERELRIIRFSLSVALENEDI